MEKEYQLNPNYTYEEGHPWTSKLYKENEEFQNICLQASEDDSVYKTFKSHPHYTKVLEHVKRHTGVEYLERIKSNFPQLYNQNTFSKFMENDKIGTPHTFIKSEFGDISATTLRYINVLGNLITHFNNLDGFHISEVGDGYGGQATIISRIFKDLTFTLSDLPQCIPLLKKYLKEFNITPHAVTSNPNNNNVEVINDEIKCDLFISTYSLTELSLKRQELYIDKMIKNADRGYITYNETDGLNLKGWEDVLTKLGKKIKILPEEPLTGQFNKIIIWGHEEN
jgi:putative sugar O-methyltransferase